eukprot:TRINITY_DN4226_c0_g1_i1.p1 TRINITY_DN4226_c0_g1~~TRINITY_DN4226_c0_g1_i1.p1  ORF type:complete len:221 (-),score=6.31 TRINITY_DN4226_c0_g1_i1:52-714(-)
MGADTVNTRRNAVLRPTANTNRRKRRCFKPQKMFRGVRMRKWGRWVSEIRMPVNGTRVWLGSFASAIEAALAYDFAAYCLRGAKAKLNFWSSPSIVSSSDLMASCFPPSPRRIQSAASQFSRSFEQLELLQCQAQDKPPECLSQSELGRLIDSENNLSSCAVEASPAWGGEGCRVRGEDVCCECDGSFAKGLPAIDDGALDSLCSFLASHSHTQWWLVGE